MTMGCIASIAAERKNSKVQQSPSPNTLRGDLISRDEARNRRNKSVTDHHIKTNKLAQTMAYNTLAEKEMMSTTSTERSYRSGRGFLINTALNGSTNASEKGSSSTLSEGSADHPGLNARNKNDNAKSSLPFAVPEEETSKNSNHQGQQDTKGQQEPQFQASDVNSDKFENVNKSSETNSQLNLNIHEHGQTLEDDSDSNASHNNNEKEKKHARVRFNDSPTEVIPEVKVDKVRDSENERTEAACQQNSSEGSMTSADCLSAG